MHILKSFVNFLYYALNLHRFLVLDLYRLIQLLLLKQLPVYMIIIHKALL